VVCTLHQTAVGSEAEANLVEALHESGDVRLALVA